MTDTLKYVLQFDGQNDVVEIPGFQWPAGGGPVTVEFWNKVEGGEVRASSAFTVGNQNNPNRFQAHAPWSNRRIYWDYGHCGRGPGRVHTDYGNYLNKWTHVALVSEGTGGKFIAIYLDGKLVAAENASEGPGIPLSGLWLGQFLGNEHKGKLADFRIWDRVRTQAEIARDRDRRLTGKESGLVGYWPLAEGSGNEAFDRAGGNHGTLKNGATWVSDPQFPLSPASGDGASDRPSAGLIVEQGTLGIDLRKNPKIMNPKGCEANRGIIDGRVEFEKPFSEAPALMLGLTQLDFIDGNNHRITVGATRVDKAGFNYNFNTWCDTKVWSAVAQWIAIGR